MTGTCHNMYLAPACVGLVPLTLLMIRHHAARASWAIRVHLQFLSHAPYLTWFNGSTATDLPQYSWAIIWAVFGFGLYWFTIIEATFSDFHSAQHQCHVSRSGSLHFYTISSNEATVSTHLVHLGPFAHFTFDMMQQTDRHLVSLGSFLGLIIALHSNQRDRDSCAIFLTTRKDNG